MLYLANWFKCAPCGVVVEFVNIAITRQRFDCTISTRYTTNIQRVSNIGGDKRTQVNVYLFLSIYPIYTSVF